MAASIVALAALATFIANRVSGAGTAEVWLVFYADALLGGSPAGFAFGIAAALYFVAAAYFFWKFAGHLISVAAPRLRKPSERDHPLAILRTGLRNLPRVLLIIPAVWLVAIAGIAMGEVNGIARARLADAWLIGAERAIFGNYVFALLGAVHYPHWLAAFIIWSFYNLSIVLLAVGIVIAYASRRRFREFLIAFCLGIMIMLPIWFLLPALSPQDRYIDNVYHLPMPPAVAAAVAEYRPQPEIASFLKSVRAGKAQLPSMPTSTFPSAHIFWAAIAAWYLFRSRKWLGWIGLPFLAAASFGTVLLAQHYFLDVPAGLAVAAVSIWLARDTEAEIEEETEKGASPAAPASPAAA